MLQDSGWPWVSETLGNKLNKMVCSQNTKKRVCRRTALLFLIGRFIYQRWWVRLTSSYTGVLCVVTQQ